MFLGQSGLWQQVWSTLSDVQCQIGMSKQKNVPESDTVAHPNDTLRHSTERFKNILSNSSHEVLDNWPQNQVHPTNLKRRRTDDDGPDQFESTQASDISPKEHDILPPVHLVDDLVELYFANIHPWIPILHISKFKERMADPEQRKRLKTILHAILSITVRFSDNVHFSKQEIRMKYARQNRERVIIDCMESFSVKNLQALVIIAFDTVSCSIFQQSKSVLHYFPRRSSCLP